MHPRLFTIPAFHFIWDIGPVTLHTYGVVLVAAFAAALFLVSRQARRAGLDPVRLTDLAIYVLVAGLIGAKLLLVVVEWRAYSQDPHELWSVLWSGGVFYGGLLAALPVAGWYARRYHLDGWQTADVLAPGVAVGQAIGRWACFAAGCCYGKPASVPWAVTFRDVYATRLVGTPVDIALHPAQIYESLATALILVVLLWQVPRKRFHGQVALTYIVLYSVARFVVEFYRGDSARGTVLGGALSTSQGIAFLLVLGVLAIWPYLRKKKPVATAAS